MNASFFGIIFDKQSGDIKRIINPDHDWELLIHHVSNDEFMLRIRKEDFGINKDIDGMSLGDVDRITRALSP